MRVQQQFNWRNRKIPDVHAYRDAGRPTFGPKVKTRWEPRKVFCIESSDHGDRAATEYVVKYIRRGERRAESAAAATSELLCNQLLNLCDIGHFKPAYVIVSEEFAKACRENDEIGYDVDVGTHFGTEFAPEIEPDGPCDFQELKSPHLLVSLWVFDSWVMNIDRNRHGNAVWRLDEDLQWALVAADQSDCFCGAAYFCSGDYLQRAKSQGAADMIANLTLDFIASRGIDAIYSSIAQVQKASKSLDQVVEIVPPKWWQVSGIVPEEVVNCLTERARRLKEILNPSQWEVPGNGFSSGVIIDI